MSQWLSATSRPSILIVEVFVQFYSSKYYLSPFKKAFNIIAITEIWINVETDSEFFLKGYRFHCTKSINRPGGGGMAVFV